MNSRVTPAKMKLCKAEKNYISQYYYCFDCIFECQCHHNDLNLSNSVYWDSSHSFTERVLFWNPSGENECFHNNCKTWADTVMLTSAVIVVLKTAFVPTDFHCMYHKLFPPKMSSFVFTEESQSHQFGTALEWVNLNNALLTCQLTLQTHKTMSIICQSIGCKIKPIIGKWKRSRIW